MVRGENYDISTPGLWVLRSSSELTAELIKFGRPGRSRTFVTGLWVRHSNRWITGPTSLSWNRKKKLTLLYLTELHRNISSNDGIRTHDLRLTWRSISFLRNRLWFGLLTKQLSAIQINCVFYILLKNVLFKTRFEIISTNNWFVNI